MREALKNSDKEKKIPKTELKNASSGDKAKGKVRGSNAVRRAATRIKVLEAGITILHNQGYHAATTTKVAQQAKVSRGSLLHQFPTHCDLMLAVVEHIIAKHQERTAKMLANLDVGMEQFKGLTDVVWATSKSHDGIAFLEVLLASRSVPELSRGIKWKIKSLINTGLEHAVQLANEAGIDDRKGISQISALTIATAWGMSIMQLGLWDSEEADDVFQLSKINRDYMIENLKNK